MKATVDAVGRIVVPEPLRDAFAEPLLWHEAWPCAGRRDVPVPPSVNRTVPVPSPRRFAVALAAALALAACSSSTEDAPADSRPGVGGTDLEAPAPNEGRTNLQEPDAGGS